MPYNIIDTVWIGAGLIGLAIGCWIVFRGIPGDLNSKRLYWFGWKTWTVVVISISAFLCLEIWLFFMAIERPFEVFKGRIHRGMHYWAMAVADVGAMVLAVGVLLQTFTRAYIYYRNQVAHRKEPPKPFRKSPSPQPTVQGASEDMLWKKGPEAVADYLFDVWYFVGIPEEWDSDERLWEVVDTKLKQLYQRDNDQLAFYERIQKRYQERLEELM